MGLFGGYDGSIKIDSEIDTTGFNSDLNSMDNASSKSVSKIGSNLSKVGTAFSTMGKVIASVFQVVLVAAVIAAVAAVLGLIVAIVASARELFKMNGYAQGLKDSFAQLKVSFALAFRPLIDAAIPYIQAAINWLINLFNTIAMITGALMGQTSVWQATAVSTAAAAGGAATLAKNTEKAGKAAKGALAAFDQLNVLQMDQPETPTAGGVGGAVGTGMKQVPVTPPEWLTNLMVWWEELKIKVGEVWNWIWKNALEPLWTWLSQSAAPPFLGIISESFLLIKDVVVEMAKIIWDVLGPAFIWLWTTVLQPLFVELGGLLGGLGTAIVGVLYWILGLLKTMREGFGEGGLTGLVRNFNKYVMETFVRLGQWIYTTFVIPVVNAVAGVISTIGGTIKNVANSVQTFVAGIVNNVIGFMNSLISSVIAGINRVITAFNSIPLMPDIGYIPFSPIQSMKGGYVSISQLPKLATGAVIPPNAAFAAILGDQRSGKNIEAPEGLIRQIIQEEIGNVKADVQISFAGSLGALVRELKPIIDKENVRIGNSLVTRVA